MLITITDWLHQRARLNSPRLVTPRMEGLLPQDISLKMTNWLQAMELILMDDTLKQTITTMCRKNIRSGTRRDLTTQHSCDK